MKTSLLISTSLCVVLGPNAWAGPISVPGVALTGNLNRNTVQPSWATSLLNLTTLLTDAGFIDLRGLGASMTGCAATPTDDSAAWSAMVAQANADWTTLNQTDELFIPAGCTYLNAPVTQFGNGVPVHIHGAGSYATKIILGTGFTGDLIGISDNFTQGSMSYTNTTIGTLTTYDEGPRIHGLMIDGNRGSAAPQSGIVFYDQNEFAIVSDVEMHYLNGCALCIGLEKNTTWGMTRESQFEDIRIFSSGGGTITNGTGIGVTTAPELGVYSSCSGTSCTGTGVSSPNSLTFTNLRLYAHYYAGMFLCPGNTVQGMHNIRVYEAQVEGRGDGTSTSDGIRIGDPNCGGLAPYDLVFTASSSNVPNAGQDAFHVTGPSSYGTKATAPNEIDLIGFQSTKGGQTGNSGLVLDYGYDISASVSHCNDTTCLNVGAGVSGPIVIDPGPEINAWTTVNSSGANLNLRGAQSYSFTPSGQFSSGGGALTFSGSGVERVFGNMQIVNENFTVTITTLGTGTLQLNLPIASTNAVPAECSAGNVSISGSATVLPSSATYMSGQVSGLGSTIALVLQKATGSSNVTGALLTAGTTLTANLTCAID